jgi:DNA-binding XRE family transcriptional regulator
MTHFLDSRPVVQTRSCQKWLQVLLLVQEGIRLADAARMSDSMALALQRAIRAERARAGLSQAELGERIGWSRQTVVAVETGSRRVWAHELPDICRALGVPLSTLLFTVEQADRDALQV